jgi:hypothetical protein
MEEPLTAEEVLQIKEALLLSWSPKTCVVFDPQYPFYSQCAQTALVVHRRYGGVILRTDGWPPDGVHFYNCIGGVRHDFTAEQFKIPDALLDVKYLDIPSSVEEASKWATSVQMDEMWSAFLKALSAQQAGQPPTACEYG